MPRFFWLRIHLHKLHNPLPSMLLCLVHLQHGRRALSQSQRQEAVNWVLELLRQEHQEWSSETARQLFLKCLSHQVLPRSDPSILEVSREANQVRHLGWALIRVSLADPGYRSIKTFCEEAPKSSQVSLGEAKSVSTRQDYGETQLAPVVPVLLAAPALQAKEVSQQQQEPQEQ